MADRTYPPLSALLAALRGGDIGMPGSEVYPPAPAGNQPYNPVGKVATRLPAMWAQRLSGPGQVWTSTTPMGTAEMIRPAQDILKLARGGWAPR